MKSESDIIEWIWVDIIKKTEGSLEREVLLFQIAEQQAAKNASKLELRSISSELLPELTKLKSERLVIVSNQFVDFDHEVIGNWARFQILRTKRGTLTDYLKAQTESLFWNSAVRLYGAWLLQHGGFERWIEQLEELSADPSMSALSDSFLDSLLPSANRSICSDFFLKASPKKIRAVLSRFKIRATVSDVEQLAFLEKLGEKELVQYAEANMRLPVPRLWEGIFDTLLGSKDVLFVKARAEVVDLCEIYLRSKNTDTEIEQRKLAATVSFEFAKRIKQQNEEEPFGNYDDEIGKQTYRNVFLGYEYIGDEAITFLTDLGKLVPSDTPVLEKDGGSEWHEKEEVPAAADGPKSKVDHDFADICLEEMSLLRLAQQNPKLAKQLILASCLREPGIYRVDRDGIHPNFGLRSFNKNFYPPSFSKGPFFTLLQADFDEGLDCIKKLVGEVQKNWRKDRGGEGTLEFTLDNGGVEHWAGSWEVYNWHRDQHHTPNIVVCALMALEKFLESKLEQGQDIEPLIEKITHQGGSLVFLGLSLSFVKRYSKLLDTKVGLYLGNPYLLHFDSQISYNEMHSETKMLGWTYRDPLLPAMRAFHCAPHRQRDLKSLGIQHYLASPESKFAKRVPRFRDQWEKQAKATSLEAGDRKYLETLSKQFHTESYVEESLGQGTFYRSLIEPDDEDLKVLNDNVFYTRLLAHKNKSNEFIDNGLGLTDAVIHTLFEEITQLDKLFEQEQQQAQKLEIQSVICAIGLMLTLGASPKMLDQKSRQVVLQKHSASILKLAADSDVTTAEYRLPYKSLEYAVKTLCGLWLLDIGNSSYREAIAKIVVSGGRERITWVARTLRDAGSRGELAYSEAINFTWWYAVANEHRREIENYKSYGRRPKPTFAVPDFAKAVKDFSEGKKVETSKDLNIYLVRAQYKGREAVLDLEIDTGIIASMYSRGVLNQEILDELPEDEALPILSSSIGSVVKIIISHDDSNRFQRGPEGFEYWTITSIAYFLARFPHEGNDFLWKQVIDLGPEAHYFIETFMITLLSEGTIGEKNQKFLSLWERLVLYAFDSKKWRTEGEDVSWRYLDDGLSKILGLDDLCFHIYNSPELLDRMWKWIEIWAQKLGRIPDCRAQFIRLLNQPSASSKRLAALSIVSRMYEENAGPTARYRRYELDDLSRFLSNVLDSEAENVKKVPEYLRKFNNILRQLTEKQHARGLLLAERLRLLL